MVQPRTSMSSLAEPPIHFIDARCLEYLTIEMIQTIIDSATVSAERQAKRERKINLMSNISSLAITDPSESEQAFNLSETDLKNRLEDVGFKLGWRLAERLSKDKPPFTRQPLPETSSSASGPVLTPPPETIEAIKFVCKDIWLSLYDKQIDNLRTNHRGTWVLQDNAHRPLSRLSGLGGDEGVQTRASRVRDTFGPRPKTMYVPTGVIRGATACLGIPCTVTAELLGKSQCTFHVKTLK